MKKLIHSAASKPRPLGRVQKTPLSVSTLSPSTGSGRMVSLSNQSKPRLSSRGASNGLNFQPKAIIFDMDGVIVDSMPYHFIAWYEALRPFGVRVSCFDVFSREGERWDKTLKELLGQSKIKPSKHILEKIFLSRQKIFHKYFKRFIFSGVEEFLKCLKKNGYVLGLATGTPKCEVEKILPHKLRSLFNCIIAGNEVKNGKPHPRIYLKAAEALKIRPSRCVVVENAPLGIEAAKKAGMFCIGLTTSLPKEYLRDADIVFASLEEITGFINKSCQF